MGHRSSKAGTIQSVTFMCTLYSLHTKFSNSYIDNAHIHSLLTAHLFSDMAGEDPFTNLKQRLAN